MKPQLIQQGAEAVIYKINNQIIKHRTKKSYRISELDTKLRLKRTKSEAKILKKLHLIIPVPKIINSTEDTLILEYLSGKKLSKDLENLSYKKIAKQIGENLTKLHNQDIIHGDLTTSNMILSKKDNQVYFIDFGLSFHSARIEDKAVDLHLLKQALDAKHFQISEKVFKIILNNYKSKKAEEIKQRIKIIESRGRYKNKI